MRDGIRHIYHTSKNGDYGYYIRKICIELPFLFLTGLPSRLINRIYAIILLMFFGDKNNTHVIANTACALREAVVLDAHTIETTTARCDTIHGDARCGSVRHGAGSPQYREIRASP